MEQDLKEIPKADQRKIVFTIFKKLSRNPVEYGKALVGNLKGYFRLRIGKYRAIYKIIEDKVIVKVLAIGLRKDFIVYTKTIKRI